jgi:hypothetical protein
MCPVRHPTRHVLLLAGIGLILAVLFSCRVLPAASAAGEAPFTYQYDQDSQNSSGSHDAREQDVPAKYRHDQMRLRELGYGLPDRYTIHKGQTCELRCKRIRGSLAYSCREYRC